MTSNRDVAAFRRRVEERDLTVAVVGLGYVGLPLAIEFANAGFDVVGVDIDADRVEMIRDGRSYLTDLTDETLSAAVSPPGDHDGAVAVRTGTLRATTDFDVIVEADTISICVPTPLRKERSPDMSYILAAVGEITRRLCRGQLVVLESTTYPGTTRELVMPMLEQEGLKVGTDVYLVFSPERVDPGNEMWGFRNTPKVIGGITDDCLDRAVLLYGSIADHIVPVSSSETAEMTKLLENTFRSVNIALVNELAIMCDRLGVDVWEIIEAAATKPFGFMKFLPGPGLGGHCIPVDPHYLSWKLKQLNYTARFIELATEVNAEMPRHVVDLVATALNDLARSVKGSKVLVLGVAYKPDVNDVRESPALTILELLHERGADVTYHDPLIPDLDVESGRMTSCALDEATLSDQDCVLIVTHHSAIDYAWVADSSGLVVDTRNSVPDPVPSHVVRL